MNNFLVESALIENKETKEEKDIRSAAIRKAVSSFSDAYTGPKTDKAFNDGMKELITAIAKMDISILKHIVAEGREAELLEK